LVTKDMSWVDFTSQALSAHWLAEYKYCQTKAILGMQIEEEKPKAMVEGTKIHEAEAQKILEELGPLRAVKTPETVGDMLEFSRRQVERALRDRLVLANKKGKVLFLSVIPELSVWGIPDAVDCTNGTQPIIIETKTTSRLPFKVWDDSRVQIGLYILGLGVLGFDCKYGLLRYQLRENPEKSVEFSVFLDNGLRNLVEDTVDSATKVLCGVEYPAPPNTPNKCKNCRTNHVEIYKCCQNKLA
jgi:CRISPR/Cas system-associated exonuclease Cas4 (RecB family)